MGYITDGSCCGCGGGSSASGSSGGICLPYQCAVTLNTYYIEFPNVTDGLPNCCACLDGQTIAVHKVDNCGRSEPQIGGYCVWCSDEICDLGGGFSCRIQLFVYTQHHEQAIRAFNYEPAVDTDVETNKCCAGSGTPFWVREDEPWNCLGTNEDFSLVSGVCQLLDPDEWPAAAASPIVRPNP